MGTKYFSGETELRGNIMGLRNSDFAARFPGIKGRRFDGFDMMVAFPEGAKYDAALTQALPVTRVINYKSNPSKHECDTRCRHAKGRVMNCECSCEGKNHGAGG